MVYKAAKTLAKSLTEKEKKIGCLYPSLTRIKEVSRKIAAAVKNFK